MNDRVPDWVRLGLVVTMAVPQLVIGVWATVDPAGWFDTFPGFDPRLVAAEPPYNEHLATDAGAGFLAAGVALLAAAIWANRASVRIALLAFVAFTVPHVAYHGLNPADRLSGAENVMNVALLASGLVLAAVFAYGSGDRPSLTRTTAAASTG